MELIADPDLGHLLQPAIGGAALGAEYGLPWAMDPAVIDDVAAWVFAHAG